MTTLAEAKEMRDMIRQVEENEAKAQQRKNQQMIDNTTTWYDTTIKPTLIDNPVIRVDGEKNYNDIESLIISETNPLKRSILENEKIKANDRLRYIKKHPTEIDKRRTRRAREILEEEVKKNG